MTFWNEPWLVKKWKNFELINLTNFFSIYKSFYKSMKKTCMYHGLKFSPIITQNYLAN